MFTLVLCYLAGDQFRKDAEERVRSTYIPQIGSTINAGNVRYGTYRVAAVGQSIETDSTMSTTIYVYLEETD